MNWSRRYYGQGKLTWRVFSTMKLNANYIYDNTESQGYNRMYYYNPNGMGTSHNTSQTLIMQLSQTVSQSTFYSVGFSWFQRGVKYHKYDLEYEATNDGSGDLIEKDVPDGPHYVHPKLFLTNDPYSFYTGGTDMTRFRRTTITKLLKADLSSQLDNYNLVKVGVEVRRHNMTYENIALQPIQTQTDINLATDSPYIRTRILPVSSLSHDVYDRRPTELSAYIQDKLEFRDFILNIGLRFDYFEPDGHVLNDEHPDVNDPLHYTYTVDDPNIYSPIKPENRALTLEERQAFWYRKSKAKSQFSPQDRGILPDHRRRRGPLLVRALLPDPPLRTALREPGFQDRLRDGEPGDRRQHRPQAGADDQRRDRHPPAAGPGSGRST